MAKAKIFVVWAFLWLSLGAFAGDVEDAATAYEGKDYATALKLLQPLAGQGNPLAQHRLGLMTFKGEGLAANQAKGIELITSAANAGVAKAQALLAYLSFQGTAVPKDYVVGIQWAEKAAAQDEPMSQLLLGAASLRGWGVPQNFELAVTWFRRSAAQGNPLSQYELGKLIYVGRGTKVDKIEGERLIKAVSEKFPPVSENAKNILQVGHELNNWRNGLSRLTCGVFCAASWGANRDQLKKHLENEEWIELSARILKVGFQTDMAYYYLGRASEGMGDLPAAVTYYKLALDPKEYDHSCAGFINNCDGLVFPKDVTDRLNSVVPALEKKAELERRIAEENELAAEAAIAETARVAQEAEERAAFTSAVQKAQAGDGEAQYHIAKMYFSGTGTKVDDKAGVIWLGKAAQSGISGAQYDFGERYRLGAGVPKDLAKAEIWFLKAIRQGHEDIAGGYAIVLEEKKELAAAVAAKERAAALAAENAARKAVTEKEEAERKRKSDNAAKLKSL